VIVSSSTLTAGLMSRVTGATLAPAAHGEATHRAVG
jgi:hypothetical protein